MNAQEASQWERKNRQQECPHPPTPPHLTGTKKKPHSRSAIKGYLIKECERHLNLSTKTNQPTNTWRWRGALLGAQKTKTVAVMWAGAQTKTLPIRQRKEITPTLADASGDRTTNTEAKSRKWTLDEIYRLTPTDSGRKADQGGSSAPLSGTARLDTTQNTPAAIDPSLKHRTAQAEEITGRGRRRGGGRGGRGRAAVKSSKLLQSQS